MKAPAILSGLASLLLLAAAPAPLTGTWSRGDPEHGGARLLTRPQSDGVAFQLECWRGAPSHNSGFFAGRLRVANGRGSFRSQEPGAACEIEFLFSGEHVTLRYLGAASECGFGAGVDAQGTYHRTSREVPEFAKGDPRARQ
jgi:hypothetical protein